MFKVIKSEPKYFTQAKKKIKQPKNSNAWQDEIIAKIRPDLREDILKNEQKYLCIYCETKITSDGRKSNIDHFKLRDYFPKDTLNYDNLFVSCNKFGQCSSHKDKNIKESDYDNIVNPTIDEPKDFFDYLLTGEIKAKANSKKAEFTINIFKLNKLKHRRYKISETLANLDLSSYSLEEIKKDFDVFPSFIEAIYPKLKLQNIKETQ